MEEHYCPASIPAVVFGPVPVLGRLAREWTARDELGAGTVAWLQGQLASAWAAFPAITAPAELDATVAHRWDSADVTGGRRAGQHPAPAG